jgi:hypothetical protein
MLDFRRGKCYHIGIFNERKERKMKQYKSLSEMWIARDTRFAVSYDTKTFKYGIVEKKTREFVSPNRWVSRKFAEEYLAVAVALGQI